MADLMLYQQLTEFLKSKLPTAYRNKLLSWIDRGTLINQGAQVTSNGVEIAHIHYTAVLMFDEFPYRKLNAATVMALIQCWLNDNDELRCRLGFDNAPFELEIYDDDTATLTFDVEFQEPISAMPSAKGQILIDGEKYAVAPIEIYYAEQIDVDVSLADE